MQTTPYSRISAPKQTVNDYLQSLSNEDLLKVYGSTFQFGIGLPELIQKLKKEIDKRNLQAFNIAA